MSDLDQLADFLRAQRIALAYTSDGVGLAWHYTGLPKEIRRAIHNRRRSLARLMRQGDIRLCPSPPTHRSSWRYDGNFAGQQRYICDLCAAIDATLAHTA